ncbi:hypothetical protein C9374_006686 [Naegleria lovaniensis]|uniref:Protein kinase domain-containing protein n=1 Tax=Naegleria lovaniensis TaxID=51637 RepID=A0AA88GHM5_NAELO|nr:uncharacterized protein C9374_006686 [Naegleria lovaniensis]KAG2379569.1 hypothetical protein C9374_006686 [Naegleria lovaniensis]
MSKLGPSQSNTSCFRVALSLLSTTILLCGVLTSCSFGITNGASAQQHESSSSMLLVNRTFYIDPQHGQNSFQCLNHSDHERNEPSSIIPCLSLDYVMQHVNTTLKYNIMHVIFMSSVGSVTTETENGPSSSSSSFSSSSSKSSIITLSQQQQQQANCGPLFQKQLNFYVQVLKISGITNNRTPEEEMMRSGHPSVSLNCRNVNLISWISQHGPEIVLEFSNLVLDVQVSQAQLVIRNCLLKQLSCPYCFYVLMEDNSFEDLVVFYSKNVKISKMTSNKSQNLFRLHVYDNVLIQDSTLNDTVIQLIPSSHESLTIIERSTFYGSLLVGVATSVNLQQNTQFYLRDSSLYYSITIFKEFTHVNFTNTVHRYNLDYGIYQKRFENSLIEQEIAYLVGVDFATMSVSSTNRCVVILDQTSFRYMTTTSAVKIQSSGVWLSISNSEFVDNESRTSSGGAIYLKNVFQAMISNTLFKNNRWLSSRNSDDSTIEGGGALYHYNTLLLIQNCVFFNNTSHKFGGAVLSHDSQIFQEMSSTASQNTAKFGGALAVIGTRETYIASCVHSENQATEIGGGFFLSQTLLTISVNIQEKNLNKNKNNNNPSEDASIMFSKNKARQYGGGYFLESRLSVVLNGETLTKIPKEMWKTFVSLVVQNNWSEEGHGIQEFASFPVEIQLRHEWDHSGEKYNSSQSMIATHLGKKLKYSLELMDMFGQEVPFDQTFMKLVGVDDRIFAKVSLDPTSMSNHSSARTWNTSFTFQIFSHFANIELNPSNMTIIVAALQWTPTAYEKRTSTNVSLSTCPPFFEITLFQYEITGIPSFYCGFQAWYLVPFILLVCLMVILILTLSSWVLWRKIKVLRMKALLLNEKEKAEMELNEKLLNLQALYTSELENKHSFKNWLIKVEDIKLLKKIAEGGNGMVYLAKWNHVDVALKAIKIDDNDLDSSEFEHEASLLSSLRHPNIVNFYGVCLADSQQFMVTEFMQGGSLDHLIYSCKKKTKYLTLSQKIHLLKDISSGMSYLHEGRDSVIIHRDLKPANLLLTNDMTCKVCDFGLSKLANAQNSNTGSVGTLLYMSPELLLGNDYDWSCDVYSFSIIMWQLVFDENVLFNSSIQRFSQFKDSLVSIVKLIAEGLRLPIPKLDNVHSPHVLKYVREELLSWSLHENSVDSLQDEKNLVAHVQVFNGLFKLMAQCWDAEISKRPSFSSIFKELTRLEKQLL